MSEPFYIYKIPAYAYDQKPLLKAFELKLPQKKWTSILGKSGSGKSTLLRMIAGLIPSALKVKQSLALLPQNEILLPWKNALENILIGPKLRGQYESFYPKALQILDDIGLSGFKDYFPKQLSGGMKQRIQLGRLLLEDADLILMDEPFSQLDALTRLEMNEFTQFYLKSKTVLLVTHDPIEALRLSDRILILGDMPSHIVQEIEVTGKNRNDPGLLSEIYRFLGVRK